MTDVDAQRQAACLERLRACHREIARCSDPQSPAEYEALIATLYAKARAHRGLQQPQQEEAALEKAAKLARKGLPERNLEVPRALERLAGCYRRRGDHDGAVEGYQAAMALRFEAGLPEAHPAITSCMMKMAGAHRDKDRMEQALEIYDRVLQLRTSLLSKGEEKCDAGIAEALHEIGSTHHILADFGTAIPYLKEAVEVRKAAAAVAKAGEGKGAIPASETDADAAWEREEEEEEGGGKGKKEEEDGKDEELMEMMYSLASTYAKNGEFTMAQPIYMTLIARRREERPVNPIKLSRVLNNAGAMHVEASHPELGLPLYQESLDILNDALPAGHPDIAEALGNLAEVYRRMDEHAQALPLFRQAISLHQAAVAAKGGEGRVVQPKPMEAMVMAGMLNNCALLLREMGEAEEAIAHVEQAVRWIRNAFSAGHPYVTRLESMLTTLRKEQDEKAKGIHDPSKYTQVSIHSLGRVGGGLD